MEFHPLSEMFPLLEGADLDALVADIREHGLRHPIMVYEDKILDGRNRFRACQKLGMKPVSERLNGDRDPVAFVISENLHRRHLSTSQRAYIAAEIATLRRGDPNSQKHDGQICLSKDKAAGLMNVSPRTVKSAALVRDQGTDDDKADVRSGTRTASHVADRLRKQKTCAKQKPKRPKRGVDRFIQIMQIVAQQCQSASETTIPQLSRDDLEAIVSDLEAARTAIDALLKELRGDLA